MSKYVDKMHINGIGLVISVQSATRGSDCSILQNETREKNGLINLSAHFNTKNKRVAISNIEPPNRTNSTPFRGWVSIFPISLSNGENR